jgi:hypothetical protein
VTDAFPPDKRGFALGFNQVAASLIESHGDLTDHLRIVMRDELFSGFSEAGWDEAPWDAEPTFTAVELQILLNPALGSQMPCPILK